MAAITAAAVKELRETTGAGMMDCKKALTETDGDMEAAIDWLRKKGLASAAKKAGRTAAEGLVGIAVAGSKGVAVEINSETDFVARNEAFQDFVETVAGFALENGLEGDALWAASLPSTGKSVADSTTDLVARIGENLTPRRARMVALDQGLVVGYVHNALKPNLGKIAVLVALQSDAPAEVLQPLGHQLAMHVAAARPLSLNRDALDPALIERERSVLSEQAAASGKPAEIIEKMVEGRLRKYYEEVVLLDQVFVIDGETKIAKVIEDAGKAAGTAITLADFVRFELGEGVEKQEEDFAAEVASTLGG